MSKKSFKTTTLSAQIAISKTETGMDYVQVLPDNPCTFLVALMEKRAKLEKKEWGSQ